MILGNDDLEIRQTTALTTVITGLRKFTNYSLQILAFTKIGDGAISTLAYCQTEEDGKPNLKHNRGRYSNVVFQFREHRLI